MSFCYGTIKNRYNRLLKHFTCKHQYYSNSLAPEWARAATEVKEKSEGQVKLGALDATQHQRMASKYGVCFYCIHICLLCNTLNEKKLKVLQCINKFFNKYVKVLLSYLFLNKLSLKIIND